MKKGFTLTETLLTLIIIGIIAGITIPPVSVAIHKQTLKIKKQKAISTIISGYKQMLALYGGTDLTDIPMLYCENSLCFAEEHNKIFNIIVDSLSDTIVDSFNNENRYNAAYALTFEETYKTSDYDTFKVDWGKLPYSFITADGMIFGIKEIGNDKNIYMDIIVDTNCSKHPNKAGEDYLEFILDKKLNILDISENYNMKGTDDYENDDFVTDNDENDTTDGNETPNDNNDNYDNEYDYDFDYENPNKNNDDDNNNDNKGNGDGNNDDNSYDDDDFNNEDINDDDNDDENNNDNNDDNFYDDDDFNNEDINDDDNDDDNNYNDDDYDPNNPNREPWEHDYRPWKPGHHHDRPWHPDDKHWHDDKHPYHPHDDGHWYEPPQNNGGGNFGGGNPGGGQGGMPGGHY